MVDSGGCGCGFAKLRAFVHPNLGWLKYIGTYRLGGFIVIHVLHYSY